MIEEVAHALLIFRSLMVGLNISFVEWRMQKRTEIDPFKVEIEKTNCPLHCRGRKKGQVNWLMPVVIRPVDGDAGAASSRRRTDRVIGGVS